MTKYSTLTVFTVASTLLISVLLSGCLNQFVERQSTFAEWHQSGLWEAFPEGDKVGDYEITIIENPVIGKSAVQREDGFTKFIGVTENGDVQIGFRSYRQLSPDTIRSQMEDMFEALSLPEPSLSREYQFGYKGWTTTDIWDQEEIWNRFPNEGLKVGFEIHIHDSLKVAIKTDAWTTEEIRVNETGAVQYRFNYRGESVGHDLYSFENRSATLWNQLHSTFKELGLPPAMLEQSEDFGHRPSFWPPEVAG